MKSNANALTALLGEMSSKLFGFGNWRRRALARCPCFVFRLASDQLKKQSRGEREAVIRNSWISERRIKCLPTRNQPFPELRTELRRVD
jgi:hypothetical protein